MKELIIVKSASDYLEEAMKKYNSDRLTVEIVAEAFRNSMNDKMEELGLNPKK